MAVSAVGRAFAGFWQCGIWDDKMCKSYRKSMEYFGDILVDIKQIIGRGAN